MLFRMLEGRLIGHNFILQFLGKSLLSQMLNRKSFLDKSEGKYEMNQRNAHS